MKKMKTNFFVLFFFFFPPHSMLSGKTIPGVRGGRVSFMIP